MVNKDNGKASNKIYKFSYGNIFKKLAFYILDIFSIFACTFFVVCLWFLVELFIQNITHEKVSYILSVVLSIAFAFIEVFIIVISFFSRKIIMAEDKVRIIKNGVQKNYIMPRIVDNILYSEIKSCDIYDGPMNLLGWNLSYLLLDDENMVEIVLKSDKRYRISVQDSEMFISEVNKRIEELNK